MKKISLLVLAAATITACSDNKPTPEDFVTIENEIQAIAANGTPLTIVSLGANGDYVLQIPKTDAIAEIAAKEKTAKFLSAEIREDIVKDGYCLLNIIPERAMEAMGTPEGKCNFRLFCGSLEDTSAEAYAVSVCSE